MSKSKPNSKPNANSKKLDRNYVSDADKFLQNFDALHGGVKTASEQAEITKHARIKKLRDRDNTGAGTSTDSDSSSRSSADSKASKTSKPIWDKF